MTSETPSAQVVPSEARRALLASELDDAEERLRELTAQKKGHSLRDVVTWTTAGLLIPLAWVYSLPLAIALLVLAIPFFTIRDSRYARRIRELEASIAELLRQLDDHASGNSDA